MPDVAYVNILIQSMWHMCAGKMAERGFKLKCVPDVLVFYYMCVFYILYIF